MLDRISACGFSFFPQLSMFPPLGCCYEARSDEIKARRRPNPGDSPSPQPSKSVLTSNTLCYLDCVLRVLSIDRLLASFNDTTYCFSCGLKAMNRFALIHETWIPFDFRVKLLCLHSIRILILDSACKIIIRPYSV